MAGRFLAIRRVWSLGLTDLDGRHAGLAPHGGAGGDSAPRVPAFGAIGVGTDSTVSGTVEARWDNSELRVLEGEAPVDEGDEGDGREGDDDRSGGNEEGQVVREDFEDEEQVLVSPSESETVRYSYVDGEFVIEWLPEDSSGSAVTMFFPSGDEPVADIVAAADVRLVGDTDGCSVTIGCREGIGPEGQSGAYRLVVEPDSRRVALVRIEGFEAVVLAEETRVPDVNRGDEVNRIELSCVGETLAASVNSEVVLTAEDDTYEEGMVSLGIEIASDAPGQAEARWDNLEMTVLD